MEPKLLLGVKLNQTYLKLEGAIRYDTQIFWRYKGNFVQISWFAWNESLVM